MTESAADTNQRWDSEAWRVKRNAKLLDWMAGNTDAVAFLLDLSQIVEVWDDLIDKDAQPAETEIHAAFQAALINFPLNPFYRAHQDRLLPLVIVCINAWLDSVGMERGGDPHERMWAFFLKDFGLEIFLFCAMLTGGWAHMRSVSMDMRRFFTHETYETWEHRHE